MKKVFSVFLVCILSLSLVACGIFPGSPDDLFGQLFDGEDPWDTAGDNTQQPSDASYKVPIILLHGRTSNTSAFYGVHTAMDKDTNSCYEVANEDLFTNPDNHEILSIDQGKLGSYLVNELGYEPNKNLFAFNYPNQDMVERNAKRLSQYVMNLVTAGSENAAGTSNFVDGDSLFASKEDQENKRVQFILIGHSMGGLVSRYYIENISSQYTAKLITICTPHYGSSLAQSAETFDSDMFVPCDLDLQPNSWLFGNEKQSTSLIIANKPTEQYAYLYQSPP